MKPRMPRPWAGGSWRCQAFHVRPDGMQDPPIRLDSKQYDGPTEFDELVVGSWFHLEGMNTRDWWMQVGPLAINIKVYADGRHDVIVEDESEENGYALLAQYERGKRVQP